MFKFCQVYLENDIENKQFYEAPEATFALLLFFKLNILSSELNILTLQLDILSLKLDILILQIDLLILKVNILSS